MNRLECPQCSSPDVTSINHTMGDGSTLAFASCHACEHRWWNAEDGERMSLPDVLDIARRHKTPKR